MVLAWRSCDASSDGCPVLTFHSLTNLSVEPVASRPEVVALNETLVVGLSCACSVHMHFRGSLLLSMTVFY